MTSKKGPIYGVKLRFSCEQITSHFWISPSPTLNSNPPLEMVSLKMAMGANPAATRQTRRSRPMTALKTTARYARYVLASLSSIAFGFPGN